MRSALKSILFCLLVVSFFFAFNKQASAQYYLPNNNSSEVPRNLNTYSQNVVLNVLSSFSCLLTGTNPLDEKNRCLGVDPTTKKIVYVESNGGALTGMGDLIGMTFNLPVHTVHYTDYLAANFGLVKTAYAQSPGYTSLQPLVKVWIIFRDFAYLLFVLVFVVIGIAIMLRVKIDPRTVMTIQNQIPKIIIGLILVTLSFAIAGLLIDLMWIIIYLIITIFHQADPDGLNVLKITDNLSKDPANFLNNGVEFGIVEIWKIAVAVGRIVSDVIKDLIGAVLGGATGWFVGKIFQGLATVLAAIILPIVIFFVLFRLWFTLLQSFIMVLINVIFAPLWILAGLLPSKQTGFGGWLKSMLANLSVFPIVVLMFVIGLVFMDLLGGNSSTAYVVPLVGDTGIGDLKAIIALGIILLTPNVANMTKSVFKSPNFNLGLIFKPVGAATSVVGKTVKNTAGSIYVSRAGTMPPQGEKGFDAVMRRWANKS